MRICKNSVHTDNIVQCSTEPVFGCWAVRRPEQEAVTVLQLPTPRWTGLSRVRCLRRGVARLVVEDGMAVRAFHYSSLAITFRWITFTFE